MMRRVWHVVARGAVCGLVVFFSRVVMSKEIAHLSLEPDTIASTALTPVPEKGPGQAGRGIRLPAGKCASLPLPHGVTASAGMLECWVRANTWDASQPAEVDLVALSLGGGDGIRLAKKAGAAALRLSRRGAAVAEMPIYDWFPRKWIRGKTYMVHGWRLVTICWDAEGCRLFLDGTEAPIATGPVDETYPDTRAIRLGGERNTVETGFDELRLHDAPLRPEKMEERYLALYYNEYDFRKPRVTAAFVTTPPRIDGRVEEAEWSGASGLSGMSTLGTWRLGKEIRVCCAYDQENLYIAFTIPYEGELAVYKGAPRDKQHIGDSVEIFLDPFEGLEDGYYQLIGNVFGSISDNKAFDWRSDPDWEWKTHVAADVWTAEVKIPFNEMGASFPQDGHVWSANFNYERPWLHWSKAVPFHSSRDFGQLIFDRRVPVVRVKRVETKTPGRVTIAWTARNATSEPMPVDASIQVAPPASVSAALSKDMEAVVLKAGESRDINTELDVSAIPKADVVFSVSSNGRLVSYQHYAYDHKAPAPVAKAEKPAPKKKEDAGKENKPKPQEEKRWSAEVLGEEVLLREKWQDNTLGISDETLPPWPPIEMEGGVMRVWGREIAYDGGLLPQRIRSQERELLAGAVQLTAEQQGQQLALAKADNEMSVVRKGSGKVTFETEGTLAGLSVRCRQTLEFDGMLRVDMTVAPKKGTDSVTVDRLTLEIPVRRDVAQYYHVIGRSNQPPVTDVGVLPEKGLSREFVPQMWLGTERLGLAWFAEEFRDWYFADYKDWIQVVPEKDRAVIRVHFISAPCAVTGEKVFTFGLQATPMRPRPEGWRTWHFSNHEEGTTGAMAWLWHWGPTSYCFSHDIEKVSQWVKGHREHKRIVLPISSLKYYAAYYLNFAQRGWGSHPKDGMITPEYKLWGKEWALTETPLAYRIGTENYRKRYALSSACVASSYQEYYVYVVNRMIEQAGINGLYLDQPLKYCANTVHRCGFIDCKGVYQPPYLVFSSREAMKRLRRLFQEKHGFTRIMFHMSNQICVPVVSLCDIFYDGETYNTGPLKVYDHYSESVSLARYRIQHALKAFGPAPMFMAEFMHRGRRLASTREFVGYNLLHDVLGAYWMSVKHEGEHIESVWRAFAGQEGVTHHPYWENADLVRVTPDAVKVSFYRKDNTLFIVAVNTDPKTTHTATLRFAPEPLRLASGRITHAEDAFTSAALPTENASLRLPVHSLDFRFVKLRFGGEPSSP